MTEDGTDIRGELLQLVDEGKAVAGAADLGHASHLRADAVRLHSAGRHAKRRVMQDEARKTPLGRTGVFHGLPHDGKMIGPCGSEELRDLTGGGGCSIAGSGVAGRDVERDPTAPRQMGLLDPAIGIGQETALKLVHQDERVEHDVLARGLQRPDRLDHRSIGRRSAIYRFALDEGHRLGRATLDAGHGPRHVLAITLAFLDFRANSALTAAQIAPEPAYDQRRGTGVRQFLGQSIQRYLEVGLAGRRVDIGAPPASRAVGIVHRRGGERVFASPGYDGHGFDRAGQVGLAARLFRPHDFEGELRHAVAELLQRQVFQNDIGRAPIGGDRARAFDRLDRRVGKLIPGAVVDPHVQIPRRDLFPIGPDATHPRDFALAERERQADGIAELRRARLGRAWRALAAAARDRGRLAEVGRPDDLPAHAHPAVDLRDRLTLAGIGQPETVDTASLHRARTLPHEALIQDAAERGAYGAAQDRRREPGDRTPNRPTQSSSGCRQNDSRHQTLPVGNSKRATMRRRHGWLSELSMTPCPV